ncbi:hypothetical protein EG68_00769 [Paragonimus skrjabini miyazakii]|uniref:CD59-like protein n=1 Tax=Paragonimus skrjabini miyazakii TaxID=59628 RepID=A0A8S9Z9M5_9TREM|nr:hypothetical protein EG68_00769 [Paragonimus skrjabini miyazakii]
MCLKLPILILLLIFAVAVTESVRNLKCYVCEPCTDGGILNKTATGCDWCEKKTLDGVVYRRCVQGECPTKLPDGFQGKYTYYCCQTDYCNESDRIGSWNTLRSLLITFVISLVRLY